MDVPDFVALFVLTLILTTPSSGSTTSSPVPCTLLSVSDAAYLPNQTSFNAGEVVTYTCDTGYELTAGDLTLTCKTDGTWNGTTPTCSIVSCSSSDIAFATKTPPSATVVFNATVTYTCDVGYDITSGDAERTCQSSGDLSGALPICNIKKCNAQAVLNAAVSPKTATFDFNTTVTYACNVGYNYSSGDLIRTCQADNTLTGSSPTCTIVSCSSSDIAFATKTPSSATVVYNTSVTYMCDVGYDITSGDAERTCQASSVLSGAPPICNIVNCSSIDIAFGRKAPVSATVVFNTPVTYTCDVGYNITSGDAVRTCQASGGLSGTLPVCTLKKCNAQAVSNAAMPTATFDFNTTVTYACNVGYNHSSGDLVRTCQADTTWSGSAPTCTIVTCAEPANVAFATKSPIQASYSYNQLVTYTCNTGYKLDSGDLIRTCTADTNWSGALPACTIVTCAAPSTVAYSTLSPVSDPYNYSTAIAYTCNVGYELTSGSLSRTCQANSVFSGTAPVCSIKICAKEVVTGGTPSPEQALYNFNTSVTYTCNLGYNHTSGDITRTCDASASWTGTLPVCTVVACIPLAVADAIYTPPDITTAIGAYITYTCTLGYYIASGDANRTCLADGSWANSPPICLLVQCNAPDLVPFSTHTPQQSLYDFNTAITYSCDLAYNHTGGNLTRTCQEDFTWSGSTPNCTIAYCLQEDSTYMVTTPNKILHSFDDLIIYGCILAYNHSSGDLNRTCQTNGIWTGVKPECVIITCAKPTVPAHASITPDVPEVNYNTFITYACDLGYSRTDGDETRRCTEYATFGGAEANCTLVTCSPPDAISDGSYGPVLSEHDYDTTVNFTCNFGYYLLSGDLTQRCDETANWVNQKPVCEIVKCPKPTEAHTTLSPDQPLYNFNTSVTSSCVIGYNLTDGDETRICQHSGDWYGMPPNCTIIECEAPPIVSLTTRFPESSIYVYLDTLTYTCNIGYEVTSGNDVRTCTETTEWTGSPPNCTIIHCPVPPDGVSNTYVPTMLDYIYNDTIAHTCYFGYNHTSGDLERKCLHDKTWSGAAPICTIITCDKKDVPHMTFDPPTADTHDFNTTIEYSCDIGYNHTYGDLLRTCNYTAEWTGTVPNCTIIECDAPLPVLYSSLAPQLSVYVYLDTLTYTCINGYERTSGDDVRTCTETTEWTGSAPNCTIIHCPIPPDGVRNTYNPALLDYIYNDTIVHTCDIGYNHSTGDLERKCLESKLWSGVTPICTIITCDKIDVQHMTFDPPTADTHDFNTTIEYSCDIGYNHTYGDLFRTCNYTGEWTGTLPNCTIIECDAPQTVLFSSLTPQPNVYVYLDTLTYTCITGYERTNGDDVRTCTETTEWTGSAPNCTIIHCPIPPDGVRNTYSQALLDYIYNDTIVHTCDIGYNYSTGDLERKCLESKTWSGVTPICTIITCDKIDVQHMTFDPPTADTHDFNTTIEYSCDIGYNHTYGDLFRTCNYTGEWTGTLPNCTIITCDPPDQIPHTSYVPVLVEHNWNTSLHYSCDVAHHYVSGLNDTTCNESGSFPPTYTDCSVQHFLAISASEPSLTWYNATVSTRDTIFDFDGMCDVTITCVPNLDDVSHTIYGTQLTMTVTKTKKTVLNEYVCTLKPFHGERNFPNVDRVVFFGTEILDFKAFLDNPIIYLAVGEPYPFIANATDGSTVTIEWEMESNITVIQSYPGAFTTGSLSYTFTKPKKNITVHAWNLVSSHTLELLIETIYRINGFNFFVIDTLANTTYPVYFDLQLLPTANIPMHDVNISVDYKHGNNVTDYRSMDMLYGVNISHYYSHLFDVQGNYFVEAKVENILGYEDYSINMRIWDSLLALQLDFSNAIKEKYIITNTIAEFTFSNVPNYGYKYRIDYGDGTVETNVSESILYNLYDLPVFMHNYTSPGVYILHWSAMNGEPSYDRDEKFAVHVQNELPSTGFILEPIGKKYPWSIVQDMSIYLNMTLNISVPIPTNATCVFYPDDGNSSVSGLTFDKSFFKYVHDYRTEGLFNATFNCSNDVSNDMYRYDIEVRKFQASDMQIIYHEYVPLNVSDSVIVYFHIDNGGFVGIPKNVYLTWDYGDGSVLIQELYDQPTFTHLYTGRGNYTVSVFVEAHISNTTNTLFNSLRLGLMYFEYNATVQFINTTIVQYKMYGIVGTTNFTIDFDDGTADETCSDIGSSSCAINHLCAEYGYHLVQVVGTNGTFVEVDNLNITCDNPINFIRDIPSTIFIPDGKINATLRIPQDGLFLPRVTCYWNMGDPIKLATYGPFVQEVTYENPHLFPFQYIALGRHTITIQCWNLINYTIINTNIIVTNENFLFSGVFDRFYSQANSPMYISSMIDTEVFSRLKIKADPDVKTHTNLWKVNVSVGETNATRHGLLFTHGLVPEYQYEIILEVCFIEEPDNCIFEPTYAKFVMPPPHAEIVGSTRRYVDKGSVTVDAYTLSYDSVFPESSNLEFIWTCESFDAVDFEEASEYLSFKKTRPCTFSVTSTGVIVLDTAAKPVKSHYAVTVTVDNNRGKSAQFTQIASVDKDKSLTIRCKINCLAKAARSSKLQLISDLPNNCPASFTWTLMINLGSTYKDVEITSFTTDTGSDSRSLTLKENTLEYGTWYLVSLTVTLSGVVYGPAYYQFLTNRPPKGGFCGVIPFNETTLIPMGTWLKNTTSSTGEYNLTAGVNVFNLTCGDWMDEGFTDDTFSKQEPLIYLFFLSYDDDSNSTHRQLLYFDPGQTSNLVSFQMGNIDDDFRATVVLRIIDVFGDYTDVRYNVRSIPSFTTADLAGLSTEGIYSVVSTYIEQFNEDLIKANRTYDYRTISRKVMDITSVYNQLELNTSSGIVLSPEDILSLGYVRTEDDKLLRWDDYWKIIVKVTDTATSDYLAKVAESYAYMLHASVVTWPANKTMTLVAIQTISRALNSSTSKLEFSNVTAAVLAAECAHIMALNLAAISDVRTFPNTEELFAAAIGIQDLIRNILAILETVLTPNLPQNPTVDEMRNYLEYMVIFKTTEETRRAPLSIQEQTFLAQKQLQKYYLQKHIKSEASKKALPHVTHALQNLTYVLERLSELGQEELHLENDYLYISVKIVPAFELIGNTVHRPRVALELNGLSEDMPGTCSASEIVLRTIVFKHNPYFWGTFADRITSYVPLFEIDGASLDSEEINYRFENEVEAQCKDQVPTYEEKDPDKMVYILFDRQHAEDDILIFVRPNTSELIYKLYFNKDVKPNVQEKLYTYSTDMIKDGQMWTPGDGYKLIVKSSDYSETGKIWIGLKPLLENSGDLSLLKRKFCANVTSVSCLALRQDIVSEDYVWDKDMCQVSLSSTRTETICTCQNTDDIITVGTTFYVPFNTIDFKSDEADVIEAIGRTPVIGMMVASVCVYILLVIWAWREDVKDQYKWSYSLMIDNDIADIHFYIVRVFTGLRNGAGTQSKIGFVLVGEDGDSNVRIMDDDSHIGFDRGSVRTLVMSTRKYLGDLICLRIWHDDSGGNSSSWYLNKINVTDLKTGKRYDFLCNQWLDYDSGDTRVDRVLNAQPQEEVRSFHEMISYTFAEHHLWFSVFMRPFKSNFTRIQRISCLLGLIYLNMIVCTLLLKTSDESTSLQEAVVGPFRFSIENCNTAIFSVAVSTVIILIVAFFFKNAESSGTGMNLNSIICKAYRKVNDKLKLDRSVLGRKYLPPAEKALKYNNFSLPNMCVYFGWTILTMAVIIATYILESFSTSWKLIKSEEWMTTMCVSMLCSFIIFEGAKVMIVLCLSLLLKWTYEPPEPCIDKDNLEEITRYNSATLTIGPQYEGVLDKPENPSNETLLANKVKRIQNHQLLKIVSQLVVYGALLYLVYTISFESRDPRSFYLKDHIENMFQFSTEVTDLESYTTWLKTTFLEVYFSSTYFGADYEGIEHKMHMEDLANVRIGPARLRQMRIQPDKCIGPLGVDMTCHNKYDEEKKETKNYCLGWLKQSCPVSERSSFFTSPAWEFTSADEVWGFPTIAQYCTYGGGGYFKKLDVNKDVSKIIFNELVQFSWFDVQTRAVILEFTLYNANTNLFVYSKFVAEFPEVGGFLPYTDIQVFRLYLNTGPEGDFILLLEFFFLLIVIAATFACAYEIATDFKTFFKSVWNLLDIVALVMSYITISIFIYKMFVIKKTIKVFQNDKNAYVGFENLAFYDFITNTAFGVLVFLLSVRVSRILGYSGKINEMAAVISTAANDLSGFLLIFGITYFSYVTCGTLLFGKEQEKYKDVFQTYGTLTEAIVGKNRVSNILTAKPGFAEFYYFTFVLFVLMTLATMAAAILNFSIAVVRKEQEMIAPTNIVEVIYDRIAKLVKKFGPPEEKKTDQSKSGRRGSDSELNDILSDLRVFVQNLRSGLEKRKSSDKYNLP